MKIFLYFYLILLVAVITLAKSLKWGKLSSNDILLYSENVIRFPLSGQIQEYYLAYPRLGNQNRGVNTTAIYVYDRFTNSSGALPQLIKPLRPATNARFSSTMVLLKSQRSYGINTTVEFYGKYI